MIEDRKSMIRAENLTKRYKDATAINHLSFDVYAGEIVGFLGPNGAGKTTTMKILTSYLAPTSGRAEVAGFDVFSQSLQARSKVGYLPEGTPLYKDMTVLEYLQFVADVRKLPKGSARSQRMRHVVEQCGLGDRLGFLIGELSKGFKQRVGLAQAILHEPEVLILDEPTSGLDPNQIIEIRQIIKDIGKEKTVVFSTHIMQEVQAVCSRVLIIADGQIVADDTPEHLQRSAQGQTELLMEIRGSLPDIQTSLRKLSGVVDLQVLTPKEEAGAGHRLLVVVQSNQDPREALFRLAVEKGFILLELSPKRASLEDIFRKLTAHSSDTHQAA